MIVIYGATGYTGKLIAELCVRRGIPCLLAGRSGERLAALVKELSRVAPAGAAMPETAVATLEDRAGLEALARRGRVLLSCAGPFMRMGPPVVDACLAAGTHYLDITGELRFMVDTFARDAEARAKKIVLANAVGFDVVPSDLAVHLAALAAGGAPDLVELGMATRHAKPSGGTLRSLIGVMSGSSMRLEDGKFVDEAIGARERTFAFPGDFGERTVYSGPIGDLATIPRTAQTKNARTYMSLPKAAGAAAKVVGPIARAVTQGPIGGLAEKALPASGEGPTLEERKGTRFAFVVEATKGGRTARATITGADGYGITAETAILAAVAADREGFAKSGALSPMQLVEPEEWRKLLESIGCAVEVSS